MILVVFNSFFEGLVMDMLTVSPFID